MIFSLLELVCGLQKFGDIKIGEKTGVKYITGSKLKKKIGA